jgi:serine/threonine protein kinase
LGNGQFGKIYVVKDKKGDPYVAKFLSKDLMEEAEVSHFIFEESQVFNFASHPFVVRCGKKFHSKHHLVYLLEYVKG